tara:strand:- start:233 stop:532 length:300 start_codon:yes stop_codon:yes gene_type:complete
MIQTINFYTFSRWFEKNRPNNFSRVGLQGLWDYLEEYEECTGKPIEFDPISLCCEYTEYNDMDDFHCDYDPEEYPDLDTIRDYTQVIELSGESFIIQNF